METWLENFARANFQRSADTAHDLKTPLNVAVLNLELLRMRLRKLGESTSDEKVVICTRAIETELRRLGRIFDVFFIMTAPPKDGSSPQPVEISGTIREAAEANGLSVDVLPELTVTAHADRIGQAVKLFIEGAVRLVRGGAAAASVTVGADNVELVVRGPARDQEPPDISKVFKFYYSDAEGNPELSLATARLIAETYGGRIDAADDGDSVSVRMTLPLGAK